MKRLAATTLLLAALTALLPAPAVAGGNFLEFRLRDAAAGSDRARWDVFATGETIVARVGHLSATFGPTDGPFHLWIERGDQLEAGSPIPESAIRVGTFRMAASGRGGYATFTMPELPRGRYTLSVCDDPCRTWGFDEWVQGWLTAVPTLGEARLVARIRELRGTAWEVQHAMQEDLRIAERNEQRLEAQVSGLAGELARSNADVERLETAGRTPPVASAPRPVIDGAAGAWIATGLVAAAGLWLGGRRRRSITVPDTPAELLATGTAIRMAPSERVFEDLDV